ncbi:MAG: ABC transporter permease [Pseudobutyrivibrio sp.]|nr:ABC transporter permease [Pseudobutyrivibrio sp.]
MVKFRDYLLIQYKRIFKLLPGIIAMILVTAVLLTAAGMALVYSETYNAERQRYKLGVVGDTEDEMISLGVYMIGTLDESRYMIELVEYDNEEEAKAAMRDAKISAYIVITEEFSDALNAMTNDAKLKYYATSGQKGISNVMMDEIAMIATNIIVYSETGICTLRQLMKEEGFEKSIRYEKINDLFMVYISALITRTNVAEITELGLSDGLSTPAYYFSGILLFFMLLLSFCAISYFLGTKDASYKFMKSKGIGARSQVLGEYIPFLTLNVICVLITMGLISIVAATGVIDASSLENAGITDLGEITLSLLPVCILFSTLGFMIFELLIGVINKILVAFMLYIGMAYVSGYFYPKPFFPETVQKAGEIIPSGVAFSYMGAVLQGNPRVIYLLIMLGYSVLFMGAAMLARRQKIR